MLALLLFLEVALALSEMPYDGLDQDGDGADLIDVDVDGWPSELVGGRDCNDRDRRVHPRAWDVRGAARAARLRLVPTARPAA